MRKLKSKSIKVSYKTLPQTLEAQKSLDNIYNSIFDKTLKSIKRK